MLGSIYVCYYHKSLINKIENAPEINFPVFDKNLIFPHTHTKSKNSWFPLNFRRNHVCVNERPYDWSKIRLSAAKTREWSLDFMIYSTKWKLHTTEVKITVAHTCWNNLSPRPQQLCHEDKHAVLVLVLLLLALVGPSALLCSDHVIATHPPQHTSSVCSISIAMLASFARWVMAIKIAPFFCHALPRSEKNAACNNNKNRRTDRHAE